MEPPFPASWTPRDDAELTAGWRLWLELSDLAWPNASWDGTPASAVRQLLALLDSCNQIEAELRRSSASGSAASGSSGITQLLRSLFFVASSPVELWRDDDQPLDPLRAELLHADLANFARYASDVLAVLSRGGGWATLDIKHRPPLP